MRVGQRLFLAVVPAIVGVALVVALAYYGEYARQAPGFLVAVAALASLISLILAWRNTRYVAQRVERLAQRQQARASHTDGRDELDSIERTVDDLSSAAERARTESERSAERLAADRRDLAEFLAAIGQDATRRLDEVRMPLHILLDNHFGDLNENQEEMLGAAQVAVDDASAMLRRLSLVAAIERGDQALRLDPLRVDELLAALLPGVRAETERRNIQVAVDVEPALPRVIADRTQLQEALVTLLGAAVRHAPDSARLELTAVRTGDIVHVTLTPGAGELATIDRIVVDRVLVAMGAELHSDGASTRIALPSTRLGSRPPAG